MEEQPSQLTAEDKEKIARADRILESWKTRGDTSNFEIAFLDQYINHFKGLQCEVAGLKTDLELQRASFSHFIRRVKQMRSLQRIYFQKRGADALQAAIRAEQVVDAEVGQAMLKWPEPGEPPA